MKSKEINYGFYGLLIIKCGFLLVILSCKAYGFSVCVDPGHGGNYAKGCKTYITGYYEKDVNLQVGIVLKDSLDSGELMGSYLFTRTTDEGVSNYNRARMANNYGADAFISIHHNSPRDTSNHTTQYSMAYYCSLPTIPITDSAYGYGGWSRDNTDTLARKVVYRIHDNFGYSYSAKDTVWESDSLIVIKYTYMASTISEASFISVFSEADEFYYNFNYHREAEADGLYKGILSFWKKQGFAEITYNYYIESLMQSHEIGIDGRNDTVPYHDCWLMGEWHTLYALSNFYEDGYWYNFVRWEHRDGIFFNLIDWTPNRYWDITIDWDFLGLHWYQAMYKGGPVYLDLIEPAPTVSEIKRLDTVPIKWQAFPGVMQSCSLYVYLSTNNKKNWMAFAGPLKYNYTGCTKDYPASSSDDGVPSALKPHAVSDNEQMAENDSHAGNKGRETDQLVGEILSDDTANRNAIARSKDIGCYNWIVPNLPSDSCFLRIIAYDMVGNRDTVISHRFRIEWRDPRDSRGDVNQNGVAYEMGDAIVFTNYFIIDLAAFTINLEAQIAATEVNGDGIVLSPADLVYLIRVVAGVSLPLEKLAPGAIAEFHSDTTSVRVKTSVDIGAVLFVFKGEGHPTLGNAASGMEMKYGHINGTTRVLVYSMEPGRAITSGEVLNLSGSGALISVEAATYGGATLSTNMNSQLQKDYKFSQNYPNPFNSITTIDLALPVASNWTVSIYNLVGQKLFETSGYSEAGAHQIEWNAEAQASGIYFYKVDAGKFSATEKMVLMK